jgi:hypothetical protein
VTFAEDGPDAGGDRFGGPVAGLSTTFYSRPT